MLSFRVSPEEYRQLRNACSSHGVRSMSALARLCVQRFIAADPSPTPLELDELRLRIRMLEEKFEQFAKRDV